MLVADFAKAKTEVLHAQGREQLELQRRQRLIPIEEQLKASNINCEIKILHGDPKSTIIDHANKGNFDLAIIGSRGLNSLQEMVLGSVSHKVVKRDNCPVMVVK